MLEAVGEQGDGGKFMDLTLTGEELVQVELNRRVLYVHVNGITKLRICRLYKVEITIDGEKVKCNS